MQPNRNSAPGGGYPAQGPLPQPPPPHPPSHRQLPAIPPLSPSMLPGTNASGVPLAATGAVPPGAAAGDPSRSIPSFDQLRSGIPRGLARLNAPNLSTYIEHYHYYHFAGNCTVYQASDNMHPGSVQIVGDRETAAAAPERHEAPSGATPYAAGGAGSAPVQVPGPPGLHHHAYATQHVHPPPHNVPPPITSLPHFNQPLHHPVHTTAPGNVPNVTRNSLPAVGALRAHPQPPGPAPPPGEYYINTTAPQQQQAQNNEDGRLKRTFGAAGGYDHHGAHHQQRTVKRTRALSLSAMDTVRRMDARSTSNVHQQHTVTRLGTLGGSSSHSGPGDTSSASRSPPVRRRTTTSVLDHHPESGLMMNDWEHVVAMYLTGEGTPDGRPLRDITRGDGRRVEDRKLLEKRRTIGKTYEKLGRDLFEKSIGYKQDGKYRRKQKMYHVIARCRIVNALRKAGDPFPNDPDDLTALIDRKLIEKANAGSAARSSGNNQNNNNNNGNGIGNGNNGNSGNPNGNSNRTGGGAVSRLLASNPTPTVVRAPLPPGSEGATVLPRRS